MAIVVHLGAERFGLTRPPLYARVDLVTLGDGREAVLEIGLAEPSFFLSVDPAAADRFRRRRPRSPAGGRQVTRRWRSGPSGVRLPPDRER